MLYIVSTPIGNLKDITLRALEVLKEVDVIACEDTRHSKILLDAYQISKPLISYHSYSKKSRSNEIIQMLKDDKKIALISDSGTPGISDPGVALINAALEEKIPFTVIPGPTAFVTALVLSGKPAHKFIFEGFLPNRTISRKNRLKQLAVFKHTIIFYESCHRIISTLEDVQEVFGKEKEIVVARELTKKFEEVKRGTAQSILKVFSQSKPRGEFVVVI